LTSDLKRRSGTVTAGQEKKKKNEKKNGAKTCAEPGVKARESTLTM